MLNRRSLRCQHVRVALLLLVTYSSAGVIDLELECSEGAPSKLKWMVPRPPYNDRDQSFQVSYDQVTFRLLLEGFSVTSAKGEPNLP